MLFKELSKIKFLFILRRRIFENFFIPPVELGLHFLGEKSPSKHIREYIDSEGKFSIFLSTTIKPCVL